MAGLAPVGLLDARRVGRRATAWAGSGHPLTILVLAAVVFAVVSGLQLLKQPVSDVPFMLFVLPIALCAIRFELRGGLAAGAVALGLVTGLDVLGDLTLGPLGYTARVVTFLALGGFLGALVAERRRLHEKLDRYHDLSLDLLCTADLNGHFTRVNPAWQRLLGHSAAELISRPFVEFVHPDDRANTEAATAGLADGINATNFINRYRARDGSYRWLEWNASADIEEGVIYATARDISEKKEAENALLHHSELLESTVRERTGELEEARLETLQRLALAAEYRDDDTHHHTERVGRTAALIAEELGLPRATVELIRLAAPLHDVGKIAVSDSILLKPGRLTTDEFRRMQEHAQAGASLLAGSRSEILQLGQEIALTHHERWDGTGYPKMLQGEEIPICGRICAVADVFDALTHTRPYKVAWRVEQAVAEIIRLSGRQFDPRVVEAFAALDHKSLLAEPLERHLAIVA